MSNRRVPKKGGEGPVEEGRIQLLDVNPAENSSGHNFRTPADVTSECQRLVCYRETVPGSRGSNPLHQCAIFGQLTKGDHIPLYTGVHHDLRGRSVVLCRDAVDAESILKLLKKCDHPNVLKPSGAWELDDKVHITFPHIEGTLNQIDESKLFIMDSAGHKDGFTKEGLQVFRDLISAIRHINMMAYRKGLADPSSSNDTGTSQVLPLQLGADRIFYQKADVTGSYHVLVGNFYGSMDNERPLRTLKRDVNSITRFNWKGLGVCLDNLLGGNGNAELNHLRDLLKGPSAITFDDIMWEPALWDAATKMHFIREVYFSIHVDTKGRRAAVLKDKPELGLHDVIKLLGVSFTDDDLLGSVNFLRNKVVAHQDDPYQLYKGDKGDIGLKKSTLEQFILKNKPNYMLRLVEHIRPLKWITESPLLRSKTAYIKVLKPV